MHSHIFRDLYDAKGPFATALIDVAHDSENGAREHELRVRAACDQLTELGAPQDVVDTVSERLGEQVNEPAPVARLVVATHDGVRYDEVAALQADEPVATWAPLPDLGAWIGHRDSVVTFVLALVDHVGGDVSVHVSDAPEAEEESTVGGDTNVVHQTGTGGWAALRFQHRTEKTWRDNADAVVEEITAHVRAGHHLVLLAGDPQSVALVRKGLESVPANVVELSSGNRAEDGGDEAMDEAIRDALQEHVVSRRLSLIHELQEREGRDYAVATGVDDIAGAFVLGQVETLLIDPRAAAQTTLDLAAHPGLQLGTEAFDEPLRADLALIAAAVFTDAAVTVTSQRALGGVPAAALLRWDTEGGSRSDSEPE